MTHFEPSENLRHELCRGDEVEGCCSESQHDENYVQQKSSPPTEDFLDDMGIIILAGVVRCLHQPDHSDVGHVRSSDQH